MKIIRRIFLVALTLIVGWQVMRGARAARFEYNIFRTPRRVPQRPPDAAELGLRDVEFPSADGSTSLKGWYIASRTGAVVVAVGGSAADRTAMLEYARLLEAGGTGVLLFDWPGCGESGGKIGFGPAERDAIRGAVSFVSRQPDLRDGRIGLLGFSLGAHMAFHAASDDQRVRALVVEGVFGDPWQQARAEYGGSGPAATWGALLGDYLAGVEWEPPDAAPAAARIAPRPFLIVAGTDDHTVPAHLSREVFDLASEPKTFWLIDGAGHGEYLTSDRSYGTRLRTYIEGALAPTIGQSSAP